LKRLLKPKKASKRLTPRHKTSLLCYYFYSFVLFSFSGVWSRWRNGRGLNTLLTPRAWAFVANDDGWRCCLGGQADSCSEREWSLRIQTTPITPCGWVGAPIFVLQLDLLSAAM
jgi:hypothetical protein